MAYTVYSFIILLILTIIYVIYNIFKKRKPKRILLNLGNHAKATTSVSTESLFTKKRRSKKIQPEDITIQPNNGISKFQWVISDGYKHSNSEISIENTKLHQLKDTISKPKNKIWDILVVDDAYSIRKTFERMMTGSEINLITRENGEEAINYLKTNTPHLIITDIEMPKVDGIELLKYIRKNHKLNQIPVIVISSSIDKYMSLLGENNAQSILNKPFTEEEVFTQIWFLLEQT